MNNVKNTFRNLFNKQTKKLPKKFVMDVSYKTYNCRTDGDILTCVLQSTEYAYKYDISEDDYIIKFFMDDEWVITTIFDEDYETMPDNTETIEPHSVENDFSNCYIDVKAFAEANNMQLETAHYLIQPWLFSLGKDWGRNYKQNVSWVNTDMLVVEGNRICWDYTDYKEERDELRLSYSPVDGITYVIVPSKKPKIKRSGWVNVYDDNSVSMIFNSRDEAKENINCEYYLVDIVEIHWEG